jgi:hypothetical protein
MLCRADAKMFVSIIVDFCSTILSESEALQLPAVADVDDVVFAFEKKFAATLRLRDFQV